MAGTVVACPLGRPRRHAMFPHKCQRVRLLAFGGGKYVVRFFFTEPHLWFLTHVLTSPEDRPTHNQQLLTTAGVDISLFQSYPK